LKVSINLRCLFGYILILRVEWLHWGRINKAEWLYMSDASETDWSLPDDQTKLPVKIMKQEFSSMLKKRPEESIGDGLISRILTGNVSSLLLNK
jgi:hypothetical protein